MYIYAVQQKVNTEDDIILSVHMAIDLTNERYFEHVVLQSMMLFIIDDLYKVIYRGVSVTSV